MKDSIRYAAGLGWALGYHVGILRRMGGGASAEFRTYALGTRAGMLMAARLLFRVYPAARTPKLTEAFRDAFKRGVKP
jgi:hypothetical protein